MQIKKNEKGFITDFAVIGNLVDGIEVEEPADLEHFESHFDAYSVRDGKLIFDDEQDAENQENALKDDLRTRRERECFSFVNRGQLWYGMLTVKQIAELTAWYKAWLKVTETKVVPEKPSWLE